VEIRCGAGGHNRVRTRRFERGSDSDIFAEVGPVSLPVWCGRGLMLEPVAPLATETDIAPRRFWIAASPGTFYFRLRSIALLWGLIAGRELTRGPLVDFRLDMCCQRGNR
jgi:hypothetical protein